MHNRSSTPLVAVASDQPGFAPRKNIGVALGLADGVELASGCAGFAGTRKRRGDRRDHARWLTHGFLSKRAAKHFRVSRELARRQIQHLVIPSEVEGSRCVSLKVTSRDPSTSLGMTENRMRLGRLDLLSKTPAPMCDAQFRYILGVERDVRMAAHRRHQ